MRICLFTVLIEEANECEERKYITDLRKSVKISSWEIVPKISQLLQVAAIIYSSNCASSYPSHPAFFIVASFQATMTVFTILLKVLYSYAFHAEIPNWKSQWQDYGNYAPLSWVHRIIQCQREVSKLTWRWLSSGTSNVSDATFCTKVLDHISYKYLALKVLMPTFLMEILISTSVLAIFYLNIFASAVCWWITQNVSEFPFSSNSSPLRTPKQALIS